MKEPWKHEIAIKGQYLIITSQSDSDERLKQDWILWRERLYMLDLSRATRRNEAIYSCHTEVQRMIRETAHQKPQSWWRRIPFFLYIYLVVVPIGLVVLGYFMVRLQKKTKIRKKAK